MEEKNSKNNVEDWSFSNWYVVSLVMQIALIFFCSLMRVVSGNEILVFGPIAGIFFNFLPLIFFIRFFCVKGLKKYGGYGWAKTGLILSAVFFLLVLFLVFIGGEGCQLNIFGHLYWIFLIVQFFFICFLSSVTKNYVLEQECLEEQERIKEKYAKKNK